MIWQLGEWRLTLRFILQYITWISDNKAAWTLNVAGMAADPAAQISGRPIPQEPMVGPTILVGRKSM